MPDKKIKYTDKKGKSHEISLKSALSYPKDHPAHKAAISLRSKKTVSATKLATVAKSDNTEPKLPPVPKSPTNNEGPKTDAKSISGNAEAERKIVSNLQKLAELSELAKKRGKDLPDVDLCQVSLAGTNLFCQDNLGIPREKMPQLKGKIVPDSPIDKLVKSGKVKEDHGEVDTEPLFEKYLEKKGYKMKDEEVPADELRATQSQMVGAKIAGMLEALKNDPDGPDAKNIRAPIFVSEDGYILDGHHRWAAMVALQMANGSGKPIKMNVIKVGAKGKDLVNITNSFCDKIGIAQKAASSKKESIEITAQKLSEDIQSILAIIENKNLLVRRVFSNPDHMEEDFNKDVLDAGVNKTKERIENNISVIQKIPLLVTPLKNNDRVEKVELVTGHYHDNAAGVSIYVKLKPESNSIKPILKNFFKKLTKTLDIQKIRDGGDSALYIDLGVYY